MPDLEATIVGFAAGVLGTGFGGLVMVTLRHLSRGWCSVILGFSAGVMISVVAFDLLPEAIEIGGLTLGVLSLLLGVVLVALLNLLPHSHRSSADAVAAHYLRAGLVVGIGIAMHNFPEGLAIGAGYTHETALGVELALIIAAHNVPEGLAMAAPLLLGGASSWHVFAATVAAGLPMGFGALAGSWLGHVSPLVLAGCLGFAGGAMLFVTCDELIPEAQSLGSRHWGSLGVIAGIVTGMLFVYLFVA